MFEKFKNYLERKRKKEEERKNRESKEMDEICLRTMVESGFFDDMVLVKEDSKNG